MVRSIQLRVELQPSKTGGGRQEELSLRRSHAWLIPGKVLTVRSFGYGFRVENSRARAISSRLIRIASWVRHRSALTYGARFALNCTRLQNRQEVSHERSLSQRSRC